jgi:glycosyltransferase involved in cell wall biosynthesis/peptidoglycan/xylan/chitin deacetylase (PgdA/CDA1 family)
LNSPATIAPKSRRSRAVAAKPPGGPSFSIVIPTYQRRDVVRRSVLALAEVCYPGGVEFIVVVDGSTDGTAAALRAIELPFPLIVVEQPNCGASSARNRGAAIAANDVILFLDDDMIADPTLLDEHARLHQAGADAVIGDTPIHPDSPAGFLPESVARWIRSTSVKSPLSPFDVFSGQLSVRRTVFAELGGFDSAFTTAPAFGNEDADFGVRLLARHDVRHNPAAFSRQVYVVTPRQFMARARHAVAADLYFVSKHPELARELFERKGYSHPLTRFVYRPLARLPVLPELVARLAVGLADRALKTQFRSSRTMARFFSGARSLAYWSVLQSSGWLPFSDRLLVLCYHAIEDQSDDPVLAPYGVPPALFADQLDTLKRRGFSFITPAQLAAFLVSNAPLPRRPVLITFDDGYESLLNLARTVLQPRGIPALAFAVTGMASATNEWDQAYGSGRVELLAPEQLRDLAAFGVEVGSHSRSHREMPLLDAPEQEVEAAGSADDLAAHGLPRPRFFAYPFTFADDASKAAVRKAGYCAAFGGQVGWIKRDSDPFALPRVMILASDRGWRFWMKVRAPRLFAKLAVLRQGLGNRIRRIGNRARDPA